MTPETIERVFGRGRLRMRTGRDVEVYREAAAPGERRRYTKRFLSTAHGDFRQWTEREWRILARLVGHGARHVPDIVQYDRGTGGGHALVQTYDAGITVDHWATLLPVRRGGRVLRHVFEDAAHWWALARHLLLALHEIHALRLVHLDLKADNICLPYAPPDFRPDGDAEARLYPVFEDIALIDFAFSLISGDALTSPLPIGWQRAFPYQSPRLIAALEAGRAGDLMPTRRLDWRCDLYSLAALLSCLAPRGPTGPHHRHQGWTPARAGAARQLVRALRLAHDGEAGETLPHLDLAASCAEVLADADLAASLLEGWALVPGHVADTMVPTAPLTPVTLLEARGTAVAAPTLIEGHAGAATVPLAAGVPLMQPTTPGDAGMSTEPLVHAAMGRIGWLDATPTPGAGAVPGGDGVGAHGRADDRDGDGHGHIDEQAGADDGDGDAGADDGDGDAGANPVTPAAPPSPAPIEPAWAGPARPPGARATQRALPLVALVGALVVAALAWRLQPADVTEVALGPGTEPPASAEERAVRLTEATAPDATADTPRPTPQPAAPSPASPMPTSDPTADRVLDRVPDRSADPTPGPRTDRDAATPVATKPAALPAPTARDTEPANASAADLARRGRAIAADVAPVVADRAWPLVAPVMRLAATARDAGGDRRTRQAAAGLRELRLSDDERRATAPVQPQRARQLNTRAQQAFWQQGDVATALQLQWQAFGAHPQDAEIAGNLAFYALRASPPQAPLARTLALHALVLAAEQHGSTRIQDWGNLGVATALAGHADDAVHAWLVLMAISDQPERSCRSALRSVEVFGPALKPPAEAVLRRALDRGAADPAGHCRWPPRWLAGS
jgi:hypothetical protein